MNAELRGGDAETRLPPHCKVETKFCANGAPLPSRRALGLWPMTAGLPLRADLSGAAAGLKGATFGLMHRSNRVGTGGHTACARFDPMLANAATN